MQDATMHVCCRIKPVGGPKSENTGIVDSSTKAIVMLRGRAAYILQAPSVT